MVCCCSKYVTGTILCFFRHWKNHCKFRHEDSFTLFFRTRNLVLLRILVLSYALALSVLPSKRCSYFVRRLHSQCKLSGTLRLHPPSAHPKKNFGLSAFSCCFRFRAALLSCFQNRLPALSRASAIIRIGYCKSCGILHQIPALLVSSGTYCNQGLPFTLPPLQEVFHCSQKSDTCRFRFVQLFLSFFHLAMCPIKFPFR